jgi:hypothetical protein
MNREFSSAAKAAIKKRSGGFCEGCGQREATEYHHRKFKSRGGMGAVANGLHLCGWGNHTGCHGKAHSADPPTGWALKSWDDPLLVSVTLVTGDYYLNNSGDYLPSDSIPTF